MPEFEVILKPRSRNQLNKDEMSSPDQNGTLDAVEQSKVEASIQAKAIGERIRRLRLKRSMGLVDLGKKTGLSASFLSQLETGRVVPTIRNLARICMIFDKDLSYFFHEKKESCFRISRGADRVRLGVGDKRSPFLIAESLSALIPDRSFVPCIAEFLPYFETEAYEAKTFAGLEFVYVIEGQIGVTTDNEDLVIEFGDFAWVDGSTKRKYKCKGPGVAKAMIMTFPKQ